MRSRRFVACFVRQSRINSGHGESDPCAPPGKSGTPLDARRLDAGSGSRVHHCGGDAADFRDLSALRSCSDRFEFGESSTRRASLLWGIRRIHTPAIRTAYGVNEIGFGAIAGDGTGQTIAIVDAYDDPTSWTARAPISIPATWRTSTRSSACPIRPAS